MDKSKLNTFLSEYHTYKSKQIAIKTKIDNLLHIQFDLCNKTIVKILSPNYKINTTDIYCFVDMFYLY
jgi:hypothetical protein